MPQNVVEAFREGCGGEFEEDGVSFKEQDCDELPENIGEQEKQTLLSQGRLQAILGEPSYSRLLNINLENMMYVYNEKDRSVGRLSPEEHSFLKSKKATVIKIADGRHELKDIMPFTSLPKVESLLEQNYNSQFHNFFNSPLPSHYKLLNMPEEGHMKYYLGKKHYSRPDDEKYDIGIVFENHSKEQISYKLNSLFGEGPFSLFKTKVFKDHKNKFRIQFGKISTDDTNTFLFKENVSSEKQEEVKRDLSEFFIKKISETNNNDEIFLAFKQKDESLKNYIDFSAGRYYFDALALKKYNDDELNCESNTGTTDDRCLHKEQIERSQNRFINFFKNTHNKSKKFDLVIYVSDGVQGAYAPSKPGNIHPAPRVIYLPPFEFYGGWVASMGIHPDLFAITGIHEFGHVFGDLSDEYYSYHTRSSNTEPTAEDLNIKTSNAFKNNCFEKYETSDFSKTTLQNTTAIISQVVHRNESNSESLFYPFNTQGISDPKKVLDFSFDKDVLNPWTHAEKVPFYSQRNQNIVEETEETARTSIEDYEGELWGGCNGGKSFRGTENSIMRSYFKYNALTWEEAWGPINSYYLKRHLFRLD